MSERRLDLDPEVGDRGYERQILSLFELMRPPDRAILAMADALGGDQFIDDLLAALVPDLLEPLPHEGDIVV
jgi:hypothetical protein